jgi:hypothetical protein
MSDASSALKNMPNKKLAASIAIFLLKVWVYTGKQDGTT